jgi:hypothetical protein
VSLTLIWITIAFVAGAVFWHRVGGLLLKKVGLKGTMRVDLIKNLDTDTLVALRRDSDRELSRRVAITAMATDE